MARKNRAALPVLEHAAVYTDLFLMTLPLLAFSTYLYGRRCLVLFALAVVTANLCDRLVSFLTDRPFDNREMSNEAFAAMLAVLLPSSVSYSVVVAAVLAAVLIGKEAFGGYGAYVFHPTAVGYVVAAVSWPEQVCRYPQPFDRLPLTLDVSPVLVDSAASVLKNGGVPNISALNLFLGHYAGPMGATATLILLAVVLYLRARGHLHYTVLAGYLAGYAALVWLVPRVGSIPLSWPWEYMDLRLMALGYELLGGTVLFAGVFFLCDPYTVPVNRVSRLAFGIFMGVVSAFYNYYGVFEAGVCFAVLFANCTSGWLDRIVSRTLGRRRRKGAEL